MPYNGNLQPLARELRKNMTDAERFLWSKVRLKQVAGHQFYRQRIIGDYIVDFLCPKVRLVVEVDGGQHYADENMAAERERDGYLKDLGLTVLRFNNGEVLGNIEGVVETIMGHVDTLGAGKPP